MAGSFLPRVFSGHAGEQLRLHCIQVDHGRRSLLFDGRGSETPRATPSSVNTRVEIRVHMATPFRPQTMDELGQPTNGRRTGEDPSPRVASPFDSLSRQALVLYAEVIGFGVQSDSLGFIARSEAERLADRCGALVDELIEAGILSESGLGYCV